MTTHDADSDERRLNVVMNGKVWSLLSLPVTALHSNAWSYQGNQVYSGVTVCSTSLCWELNREQLPGDITARCYTE